MATFYGANATLRDNTVPSKKVAGGDEGGRVKFRYDSYTLTAALSTNDLINMMKIPKGARVIDVILESADLDSSTNALLDVGWAVSTELDSSGTALEAVNLTGFFSSANPQAAIAKSMVGVGGNPAGLFKKFLAEVQVQVKIHTAGDATSGAIQVGILYTIE